MESKQIIQNALALTKIRQQDAPQYSLYESAVHQLEYLLAVFEGNQDRSKLKEINLGHFAVMELDEADPELSEAFKAVQFIATKMAKGLKV